MQEQKARLSKTFRLNLQFTSNLIDALTSDLKLNYLKKKTSDKKEVDLEGQNVRARWKWERITHFMLNIDGM